MVGKPEKNIKRKDMSNLYSKTQYYILRYIEGRMGDGTKNGSSRKEFINQVETRVNTEKLSTERR